MNLDFPLLKSECGTHFIDWNKMLPVNVNIANELHMRLIPLRQGRWSLPMKNIAHISTHVVYVWIVPGSRISSRVIELLDVFKSLCVCERVTLFIYFHLYLPCI